MKILAIDTTSDIASAAVIEDGQLLGEYSVKNKKTHSQKIMVMIQTLLDALEIDIKDISLFAAAKGPGSFTGVRIGVATIKGLAHACSKNVVGISTLEGLAYNLPFCEHIIIPVMDARQNRVYAASYIWDDSLKELSEPEAMTIEECLEECGELLDVVFVGDGAAAHKDLIIQKLGAKAHFAPANANEQRASSIACCAYDKYCKDELMSYLELKPEYLKKSQAEMNYSK